MFAGRFQGWRSGKVGSCASFGRFFLRAAWQTRGRPVLYHCGIGESFFRQSPAQEGEPVPKRPVAVSFPMDTDQFSEAENIENLAPSRGKFIYRDKVVSHPRPAVNAQSSSLTLRKARTTRKCEACEHPGFGRRHAL